MGDTLNGFPVFEAWLKERFTQKFSVREKTIKTQLHSISVIPNVSLQKRFHVSVSGSDKGHHHLVMKFAQYTHHKVVGILSCCY